MPKQIMISPKSIKNENRDIEKTLMPIAANIAAKPIAINILPIVIRPLKNFVPSISRVNFPKLLLISCKLSLISLISL